MPRIRLIWNDTETDFLASQRQCRNREYYNNYRGDKMEFWESISRRIYQRHHSTFTACQYEQKWRNLVRNYEDFCNYRNGVRRGGRWSYTGQRYYSLFRTRFWERPDNRNARRHHHNIPTTRHDQ